MPGNAQLLFFVPLTLCGGIFKPFVVMCRYISLHSPQVWGAEVVLYL